MAQLVAETLGLGGPSLGHGGLAAQAVHEPPDDQRHQDLDPDLERDVVQVVAARLEASLAEPLEDRHHRCAGEGQAEGSDGPPPQRSFDQRQEHDLPDGRALLVAVEQDIGRDDREVEGERSGAEGSLSPARPLAA